ncbi:universal stress protein [Natranaeroarchaeum aerophilus]|uniref:Universal stress protein n=1 Tax=Natranaeroarchaeum aerophilus TaxID=2917711 RepID=A0AAE3FQW2_9EURY|nr:universal stress protein [Natranaeroarchaeum aerophilus]MCL9813668.1 universal stress protein [Natranaeroarchaeum aerophilus]
MTQLTTRVLIPIAHEDDAERTCDAIIEHLSSEDASSKFTIVHVIEKGGGTPDKAPLAAREDQAERIFSLVEQRLQAAGYETESRLEYGTDVAEVLSDVAVDIDATSLVFVPRPQGRLSRLLTGNASTRLISDAPVPVIALPQPTDDEDD